jgi:hypothetical protein
MPTQGAMIGSPFEFTDDDGVSWTVREYRAEGAGAGVGAPCLVFECDGAFRLVRDFPRDWRSLVPVELSKLSWRR